MNLTKIPHISTPLQVARPPTLHLEARLRVLRSALLPPLLLAQDLQLHGIEHRVCVLVTEVDRLLEELDLA